MPVVAQTMHGRHTVCKTLTRTLTTHGRRLTALLLALVLLLCLTVSGLVGYQWAVNDDNDDKDGNGQATRGASDARGSSRLDLGSERDYLLLRPNGHGGTVRVMTYLVANRVGYAVCYAVASAYFADLPVVVAGYGESYDNNRKIGLALDVARLAGLRDSDVVMVLDSDVMFSGQDMLPYINRFIAQSAASPRELDAKAVREGRAMAPSVYSGETNCFAPQKFGCRSRSCEKEHVSVERDVAAYARQYNGSFSPLLQDPTSLPRYINSGTSIHRLWSLRELNASYTSYITKNKPQCRRAWDCDQSVIIALYLELRRWELQSDFLAPAARARPERTPSGLRAGQMQMDLLSELAAVLLPERYETDYALSTELWNSSDIHIYKNLFGDDAIQFVNQTYVGRHRPLPLQPRKLSAQRGRAVTINLSPPMLMVRHHSTTASAQEAAVFPLLAHFSNAPKEYRMSAYLSCSPWYLPMMFDQDQWEKGRDYLLSMPMELWSATRRVRVRYADVCPQHPFSVRPNWS